ncbi:Oidioi.mRNA.OKI2018_I69.chr1.g1119.t1.cds [Oikopleura dioica]|uniref:Oidioi.mRNA.OKI2018_I69.chr1.g1119.t1.cds n=1 Tax=Oikopleura dioica TaxID=34765 RepID=A0ABN7SLX9_OIKDI|nr:Oidioi.mRNA.OKI2018_I69.chr1.g1119.t1.cds [Oikopleura dioica]
MEIICAGFPKTCSKSCSNALRILGYKVADLSENIHFLSEVWYDYLKGHCSIHRVIEEYKKHGFEANQDVPGNVYWEELYHASPNAKVILTVRDSTEVWKNSFIPFLENVNKQFGNPGFWLYHRTIAMGWTSPNMNRANWTTHEVMKKGFFRNCDQDFFPAPWTVFTGEQMIKIMKPYWEAAVDQYESHNRRVQEIVPAERLLVWNPKDGWEPLCKFLGKPVPDKPIPHDNKTADKDFIKRYLLEGEPGVDAMNWTQYYIKKAMIKRRIGSCHRKCLELLPLEVDGEAVIESGTYSAAETTNAARKLENSALLDDRCSLQKHNGSMDSDWSRNEGEPLIGGGLVGRSQIHTLAVAG